MRVWVRAGDGHGFQGQGGEGNERVDQFEFGLFGRLDFDDGFDFAFEDDRSAGFVSRACFAHEHARDEGERGAGDDHAPGMVVGVVVGDADGAPGFGFGFGS